MIAFLIPVLTTAPPAEAGTLAESPTQTKPKLVTPLTSMLKNRRAFLERMAGMGALSLLPAAGALASPSVEIHGFVVESYLQNMNSREVTIQWITSRNCFSWVEYGAGNYTSKRAFAYNNGMIEANNRVNKITLDNLKPGTAYKCKIVSTEITGYKNSTVQFGETITGPMLSFTTPAENEAEIKVVIFNDIHDRPQIIPQLLYRHGYTGNKKDYDFVVFNGDCFDWVIDCDITIKNKK